MCFIYAYFSGCLWPKDPQSKYWYPDTLIYCAWLLDFQYSKSLFSNLLLTSISLFTCGIMEHSVSCNEYSWLKRPNKWKVMQVKGWSLSHHNSRRAMYFSQPRIIILPCKWHQKTAWERHCVSFNLCGLYSRYQWWTTQVAVPYHTTVHATYPTSKWLLHLFSSCCISFSTMTVNISSIVILLLVCAP